MSVDVEGARARIEPYFVDSCRITFDTKSERNETLDLVTLEYKSNVGVEQIYGGDGAPNCLIVQEQGSEGIEDLPVRPRAQVGSYTALLPATAPAIPNGSLFEVMTAVWDPRLTSMKFRVDSSPEASFLVARILYLSTRPDARDRR